MKVALINPKQMDTINGRYPHLGIGSLASILEKNNIEVKIWDMPVSELNEEDISNMLQDYDPEIVGITSNSFTFLEAKKLAGLSKSINPDVLTIVGGPHISIYPVETLVNNEFDIAIPGEAEISFLNVVQTLQNNKKLEDIRGVVYRNGSQIIKNSPEKLISNLDNLPLPARHLMPNDSYFSPIAHNDNYSIVTTVRGCPFKCFYCSSNNGKSFRMRSPSNVVDEIEFLINEYDTEYIQFYDDSFSFNKNRVREICRQIKERDLEFKWDVRTRVDMVDAKILEDMEDAGCKRIRYGMESGDQRILDIMRKGITLEQINNAVDLTKEVGGMEILAYFMIGTPGETLESIDKTISLAQNLSVDHVRFNITTAYPGTDMYKFGLESGYFDQDYWLQYARGELDYIPDLIFETEEYNRNDLEKIIKHAKEVCS
ncbi:radical SAM protein [archaeon]|jgi:anaerobic magnesium-protoporphyrin IX monomethyl ester cyclase|nr:radical SAM protein [archaeon]MBT6824296.1 radical SAM protein [archaeon]MBT7107374.1 radical SAM protein [archaeon]MBT7297340.1 radical SAM protein [archaeon]